MDFEMKVLMKRSSFLLCSAVLFIAPILFAFSCAGQPKPAPSQATEAAAPKVPEKQRKERIVVTKVPVLIKETAYYPDGLVDEYFTYKYDANLAKLLEKDTFDPARPDPIEKLISEASAEAAAADTTYDADGKIKVRHEYTLDQAKRVVNERVLDAKGSPQSSSSYAYDASGNRLEWKAFDGKGNLKAVTLYTYNSGRLVNVDMNDGNGGKTGSIALDYDGSNLLVKRSYKAPDGSVQKYEAYTYASSGNKPDSVETHRADGALVSKIAYTYGDLGQILSAITSDALGAIKDRRAYEYSVRVDQRTEVYYE
jgi:hypothetical protein